MRGSFFCLILGWLGAVLIAMPGPVFALQTRAEKEAEVQRIDARIEELKEMKRGLEGKALRAEDQAERMQFEDRLILESRQYFKIAEENRRKARLVQEEIEKLETKKDQLLGS